MAVSTLRTTLEDHEAITVVSNNSRYGSGPAASTNNENSIEGNNSTSRRVSGATDKGFGWTVTSTDLTGQHVSTYAFCTQWSAVTDADLLFASGTGLNDFDAHTIPSSEILNTGGWFIFSADVDRTAEIAGGSFSPTAVNEIGFRISIGSVGGSVDNLFVDITTYGDSGYQWTNVNGALSDFRTFETNNNEGVFVTRNGVDFCTSRIEIGDGGVTTTSFTDSGFNITFPDQALVATDYMGVTIDDSSGTLSNATIQSGNVEGASRRPDFIDIGAASRTRTGLSLLGMRLVQLSSNVTWTGGIIDTLDFTHGAADVSGATIRPRTASGVAMCDDATFGSTGIHGCNIIQVGSGHAFEITSTGTYTFDALSFSGFGGTGGSNPTSNSGANDAAIYNNSGGAVTINIINGGDTPSVRNGAGATTVVSNTVTLRVTVVDDSTPPLPLQNARVRVTRTSNGSVVLQGLTDVNGVIEDTGYNYTVDEEVEGIVRRASSAPYYKQGNIAPQNITSAGFFATVSLQED